MISILQLSQYLIDNNSDDEYIAAKLEFDSD